MTKNFWILKSYDFIYQMFKGSKEIIEEIKSKINPLAYPTIINEKPLTRIEALTKLETYYQIPLPIDTQYWIIQNYYDFAIFTGNLCEVQDHCNESNDQNPNNSLEIIEGPFFNIKDYISELTRLVRKTKPYYILESNDELEIIES
jgi:hypothetical protein